MRDDVSVRWCGADGDNRRLRIVETADGYDRVTETWTGCIWRETGREPVTDVEVEQAPDPDIEDGEAVLTVPVDDETALRERLDEMRARLEETDT